MAVSETLQAIPSRLVNVADGGHVAGTDMVYDDDLGKTQKELNSPQSQNSIDNTDYIELRDTNNIPHKISKTNFVETVRIALGDLLGTLNNTTVSALITLNNGSLGYTDNSTFREQWDIPTKGNAFSVYGERSFLNKYVDIEIGKQAFVIVKGLFDGLYHQVIFATHYTGGGTTEEIIDTSGNINFGGNTGYSITRIDRDTIRITSYVSSGASNLTVYWI